MISSAFLAERSGTAHAVSLEVSQRVSGKPKRRSSFNFWRHPVCAGGDSLGPKQDGRGRISAVHNRRHLIPTRKTPDWQRWRSSDGCCANLLPGSERPGLDYYGWYRWFDNVVSQTYDTKS